MSKKNRKDVMKAKEGKPQVEQENQKDVTKVEESKPKVEESKPQVEQENQKKAAEKVKDEAVQTKEAASTIPEKEKPTEPAALTLPEETPHTCIQDGKYWISKEDVFDKTAFECQDCEKDHPGQQLVCAARTAYLQSLTGKKAGRTKAPRAKSKKTDGAPNQTDLINQMIKTSTPFSEMVTLLAKAHYGENVKGAESRINRHVKSINAGSCSSAAEMKPYVAYLTAAPAAPAA
jgi:hypothetical protein